MAFLFVIMFGLGMVQTAKDVQGCEKSNFEAKGCSIYKKMGMKKEEVKK